MTDFSNQNITSKNSYKVTSTMDPMTYQSFQSVSLTIVCR